MDFFARFDLAGLASLNQVTHFIGTGDEGGASCHAALNAGFPQALSCKTLQPLPADAKRSERAVAAPEDSLVFLRSSRAKKALAENRCVVLVAATQSSPMLAQLEDLRDVAANALIVLNDVRIDPRSFETHDAAVGNAVDEEAHLRAMLESFEPTHTLHWHAEETGYAVLWPRAWGDYALKKWLLPGDQTHAPELQMGVAGTTCMAINRRLLDARFSNRWLVGDGLDIGGGKDSIALYRRLFPRIGRVTVYDWAQGNAQYLGNVQDGSFDFVYSAHCLEHVIDPRVALRHWLRVLKPGGHLVITVPDEDMYEQGVWPSTFNNDHKHTFTPFKRASWSPVSINVLDLLRGFEREISVKKIESLDHSFLPGMPRYDQTRTPFAECGIEFVVQKL